MPVKDGASWASSDFVEQVLRGMSIRLELDAVSGANLIGLELTLKERPDAGNIVAALADRFAVEYRRFWSGEAAKAYEEAASQADEAIQIYAEAAGVLEAYEEYAANLDKTPRQERTTSPGNEPSGARVGENPAWVELSRKLALLREQEKAMLEIKTPAHPDVQEIDERIADFQRQLESTPRFASETGEHNPVREMEAAANPVRPMESTAVGKTPALAGEKENASAKAAEDMAVEGRQVEAGDIEKKLQSVVKDAKQDCQDKLAYKQKLFKTAGKIPSFSISVNQSAIASPRSPRGSMGIVLFSGFAMAVGTGALSSGVTARSLLATIADLEPFLQVPIIGVAPANESRGNAVGRRRRRMFFRWALIASGGLIVAGCGLSLCLHFASAVL